MNDALFATELSQRINYGYGIQDLYELVSLWSFITEHEKEVDWIRTKIKLQERFGKTDA